MIAVRGKWQSITFTSLLTGTFFAISEIYLTKFFDSLLPESNKVNLYHRPGTITLLSKSGKIIQKIGPLTREKIQLDKLPKKIEQSFLAAEDRRFYLHHGIDFWGISRALTTNLKAGRVKEGGSTITQQLARIVFLSQDRTFTRKIKEASLALKTERELTKREILEQYLNNVYLGSSAYGIADASWVYFSKNP